MRETRPKAPIGPHTRARQPQVATRPPASRAPRRRRPRRPRNIRWRWAAGVLLVVVFANACLSLAVAFYYLFFSQPTATATAATPVAPGDSIPTVVPAAGVDPPPTATPDLLPEQPSGTLYFLLLGIDARPHEHDRPTRSDTMMVLRVDFEAKTARLLSFPRDMWVAMPAAVQARGVEAARINQGYYFYELYDLPGGGPQGAMDTVTLNFGIPLHGYVLVNFRAFVDVVDALGGIEIDVPTPIYDAAFPTDNYGTIVFQVPAGRQHMDGITALRYARTRHQDSDLRRILRQQQVLLAIRDSALRVDVVTRLPELWSAVGGNVRTNLTFSEMVTYGLAAQQISRENITTYAIDQTMLVGWRTPGQASVWIPQRDKIAPLIAQFLAE